MSIVSETYSLLLISHTMAILFDVGESPKAWHFLNFFFFLRYLKKRMYFDKLASIRMLKDEKIQYMDSIKAEFENWEHRMELCCRLATRNDSYASPCSLLIQFYTQIKSNRNSVTAFQAKTIFSQFYKTNPLSCKSISTENESKEFTTFNRCKVIASINNNHGLFTACNQREKSSNK